MTLEAALKQPPDTIPVRNLRALVRLHWHQPKYQLAAKLHINPARLSTGLHGNPPFKPDVITRILVALALEEKARYE